MNVLHLVAGLPPGGGIAESVPTLCRWLQDSHQSVTLVTVAGLQQTLSDAAAAAEASGVRLVRFKPSWPHFLFFSWQMLFKLKAFVRQVDVVHVHSNWTFPVWWGCWCAWRMKKVLILSPRGCLDPVRMQHSAWKKRLVGWLDRLCLRRADLIHVTSEIESEWVEHFLCRDARLNRVEVIPNGVTGDVFIGDADRNAIVSRWPECQGKRVLLYLSRIHPLKGLPMLLQAWEVVLRDGWQMVIAGPDENGHEHAIREEAQKRNLLDSITFAGALYGADKAAVMKGADLFVLPTHSENFGLVVAEALACGVPVICTKGAPWGELEGDCDDTVDANESENERDGRCGWWIDIGVGPLARALEEAMSLTDEKRRAMGEIGRRLVEAKYRWPRVAGEMEKVYVKCVNQAIRQ